MTTPFTMPTYGAWAGPLRTVTMEESRALAVELEQLGYGAVWFPEANARDVFVNLALLLEATDTLIGGTSVANIWARDALAMSTAANTLTEAFPERFVLGLGASHQLLVEGMRGHEYRKPLAVMRSYLDAMDSASYTGLPPTTPVRRMLGALGPKMLQLAADRSDGVIPYLATVEQTAISRAALPDGLVCPVQAVVLDTDPGRGRSLGRAGHTSFYMQLPNYTNNLLRLGFGPADFLDGGSDRLVDALVAHGDVDRIVARLQEHLDAGADHVIVMVISPSPDPPVETWRELAPALAELKRPLR